MQNYYHYSMSMSIDSGHGSDVEYIHPIPAESLASFVNVMKDHPIDGHRWTAQDIHDLDEQGSDHPLKEFLHIFQWEVEGIKIPLTSSVLCFSATSNDRPVESLRQEFVTLSQELGFWNGSANIPNKTVLFRSTNDYQEMEYIYTSLKLVFYDIHPNKSRTWMQVQDQFKRIYNEVGLDQLTIYCTS